MELLSTLKDEFQKRCSKNQNYSLRAFARGIGVHPAHLSPILRNKRPITLKTGRKIIENLSFTNEEKKKLYLELIHPLQHLKSNSLDIKTLSNKEFNLIQGFEHFAILELMKLNLFKPNVNWISAQLKISTGTTLNAINKLKELGYIKVEGQRWIRTNKYLKTSDGMPSSNIRESHKRYLLKAITSLQNDPIERREFNALTLAISKKDLSTIKFKIRNFIKELYDEHSKNALDDVYQLNIQFFPLKK